MNWVKGLQWDNFSIGKFELTCKVVLTFQFILIDVYSTLPNYYVGFGKNSWAVTLLVV